MFEKEEMKKYSRKRKGKSFLSKGKFTLFSPLFHRRRRRRRQNVNQKLKIIIFFGNLSLFSIKIKSQQQEELESN